MEKFWRFEKIEIPLGSAGFFASYRPTVPFCPSMEIITWCKGDDINLEKLASTFIYGKAINMCKYSECNIIKGACKICHKHVGISSYGTTDGRMRIDACSEIEAKQMEWTADSICFAAGKGKEKNVTSGEFCTEREREIRAGRIVETGNWSIRVEDHEITLTGANPRAKRARALATIPRDVHAQT